MGGGLFGFQELVKSISAVVSLCISFEFVLFLWNQLLTYYCSFVICVHLRLLIFFNW